MKRSGLVVLLLIVVLNCGQGLADEAVQGKEIVGISTAGNRAISRTQVLLKVRSRVGQMFDANTVSEDVTRIAGIEGVEYCYYNTVITEGKVQLTFVVVEKNIIRSIDFVGNRKYKAKKLRNKLGFKKSDYLDAMEVESGRDTIVELYHKKGFAFVEVAVDREKLSLGQVVYTIDEGPRVKIKSVKFDGNSAVKTKVLKKAIKTKEKKFFFWRKYYADQRLDDDVARLQDVYHKRGFLDAQIAVSKEFNSKKNKVVLTFVIEEGPVYTVDRIIYVGHEHFDHGVLEAESKLQEGLAYSEHRVVSEAKRLLKLYREKGFVDVRIEHTARFVGEDKVHVEFAITEGQRFRIGRINISGNNNTQDRVVRRILDEYDFKPGQWYNADTARGDGSGYMEKLIRRSAYMESAKIMPGEKRLGQRDAEVSLREGQTGLVMLGVGVASDSGLIGQIVLEQRNFDISDTPDSFGEFITGKAFKGAGQNLRIALQPGTVVSEYSVSFTEPYLNNKPISLNVVGSSYMRRRESYDEQRTKGFVGLEKRYKNRWRRSIGFRVENVDVDSLDLDAPKEVIDDKGSNLLGGVKIGVGGDFTDDRFMPNTGYSFESSYEQVAVDHTFGVLSGVYKRYFTVYEDLEDRKTVLATRLLGATIFGDAPVFEKFYAGGSGYYGMRGFDYRGVSTRGLQRNVIDPERKDPIGSDWIFLANGEFIVPLVGETLSGLLFVDSGAIDTGGYRASVGFGVQIMLPQVFGPVPMRFEIATPIMKDDDDETQVFSFSLAGFF